MSKKVCIIVDIDDTIHDIMCGGANRSAHLYPIGGTVKYEGPYYVFDATTTTEEGALFQPEAITIMLLAERQRKEKAAALLLGYSEHVEDHPDLYTTKE